MPAIKFVVRMSLHLSSSGFVKLDELYVELKNLKPYLPFQQIKRVLAELKWVKSMREDGVYTDPDPVEETS